MLCLAMMASCSSGPVLNQDNHYTVTDPSGHWSGANSRGVSQAMVSQFMQAAWLSSFRARHPGEKPRIAVGNILNKTRDHIPINTLIADLKTTIARSGKAKVADGICNQVRKKRDKQAQSTCKTPGKVRGADYILKGTIDSLIDHSNGVTTVYYQVVLALIDVKTNEQVWMGSKKVKKVTGM